MNEKKQANGTESDLPPIEKPIEDQREWKAVLALVGSDALAKACFDAPFDYALKLRTGEVIPFTGATVLCREWVRLDVHRSEDYEPPHQFRLPYPADRGVDVRISDIVWVMDAPCGS